MRPWITGLGEGGRLYEIALKNLTNTTLRVRYEGDAFDRKGRNLGIQENMSVLVEMGPKTERWFDHYEGFVLTIDILVGTEWRTFRGLRPDHSEVLAVYDMDDAPPGFWTDEDEVMLRVPRADPMKHVRYHSEAPCTMKYAYREHDRGGGGGTVCIKNRSAGTLRVEQHRNGAREEVVRVSVDPHQDSHFVPMINHRTDVDVLMGTHYHRIADMLALEPGDVYYVIEERNSRGPLTSPQPTPRRNIAVEWNLRDEGVPNALIRNASSSQICITYPEPDSFARTIPPNESLQFTPQPRPLAMFVLEGGDVWRKFRSLTAQAGEMFTLKEA